MKKLFVKFVQFITMLSNEGGNIIDASLYRAGKSCTLTFEYEGDVFELMLIKKEAEDGNSNN